jgi:opacity protein-like surface antigen
VRDHTTWNAGATYAVTKHVALDLRYADTNEHDLGKTYGSHFVASIKASF